MCTQQWQQLSPVVSSAAALYRQGFRRFPAHYAKGLIRLTPKANYNRRDGTRLQHAVFQIV